MTVKIMEELPTEGTKDLFYVGIMRRKDGWYHFYSDGNKNYILIPKHD